MSLRIDDVHDLDQVACDNSVTLIIPLPSHGDSGHEWDVYHDVACAVYILKQVASHAEIADLKLNEKLGSVSLQAHLFPVKDMRALRLTISNARALWEDDGEPDYGLDGDVMDLAELITREELTSFAPEWFIDEFIRMREIAMEIVEAENEEGG